MVSADSVGRVSAAMSVEYRPIVSVNTRPRLRPSVSQVSADSVGRDVGLVLAEISADTRPKSWVSADSVGQYSAELSAECRPLVSAEMLVEYRPIVSPIFDRDFDRVSTDSVGRDVGRVSADSGGQYSTEISAECRPI